jgi:serine/threonine protein phosphatase PrpC
MIETALQKTVLYLDQDMKESEVFQVAGGHAAVFSASCPGKETPNEDAAALIPLDDKSGVFVVADGLGGERAGKEAARIAVGSIKTYLEKIEQNGNNLRAAILDGMEEANRTIYELGIGAATTLAVVEVKDNTIRPFHVGDSSILVIGQRGKIKLQTVAHSPVGFAQEAGLMNEKEAMHHEERHVVSNVIGSQDMRIEVGSALKLAQRDTLLIASDGLLDNLKMGEVIERLRKGPLQSAANRLAMDSRTRMVNPPSGNPSKPDDLTFVIFRGYATR